MKFSFSWLKQHLDTTLSAKEIANIFTSIGHEVEGLEDPKALLHPFIVAYVEDVQPHPNADKLRVCKVQIGTDSQPLSIVCGAPNVKAGMYGVFAPQGTYIPGTGMTLKPTSIRGVESQGMLCSKKELLLAEESDGIINLEEEELGKKDFVPGTLFTEVYPLSDTLFDLKITPNRPDCFGVFGLARDLYAKGVGTLKTPSIPSTPGTFENPVSVSIQLPKESRACTQFMGRLIRGVKNKPSPEWLQNRLKEAGLTPISALVDITNYLSMDRARPLHVFDASKLNSPLTVRFAKQGEEFLALNDKTYTLTEQDLVVADTQGPVALAGVMGGKNSGCTLETQDVFLECATFDATTIAYTGQRHTIISDARTRFERGIDPLSVSPGIDIATALILEICGGEASKIIDIMHGAPYTPRTLSFNPSFIEKRSSVSVPFPKIEEYLSKLGFTLTKSSSGLTRGSNAKDARVEHEHDYLVQIPSWRRDIEGPEDLVEEILRLEGYNKIPALPLPAPEKPQELVSSLLSPAQQKLFSLKRMLAERGYLETITYSFISEEEALLFASSPQNLISLANPISQELRVMRPSLLPSLLKAAAYNEAYGSEDIALVESGLSFKGTLPEEQILTLSGIRKGSSHEPSWLETKKNVDIFDCKADVYAVLEAWGIGPTNFQLTRNDTPSWFHPHLTGTLQQGPKRTLGHFGAIHPKVLKAFDIKGPYVAFELYLGLLPAPKMRPVRKEPFAPSPYQKVTRDFAFIMDAKTELGNFFADIRKINPILVEDIYLFDVYQGKGLPENKKSLAIRVVLSPKTATLTDQEIQSFSQQVIQLAQNSLKATLRE